MFIGFGIGVLLYLVPEVIVYRRLGFGMAGLGIALACASLSVFVAERSGKVKSLEVINRPLTLFPPRSRELSNKLYSK